MPTYKRKKIWNEKSRSKAAAIRELKSSSRLTDAFAFQHSKTLFTDGGTADTVNLNFRVSVRAFLVAERTFVSRLAILDLRLDTCSHINQRKKNKGTNTITRTMLEEDYARLRTAASM